MTERTLRHNSFHLVQRAWAAYQAKHYDLAEQEARSALALAPNDANALSVLSVCAMQRRHRSTAVQFAMQAISHAADEAIYHYRLALIHGRFGDHKAAEPPLRMALELDPTFAPAYSLYAWIYYARGHYEIALSGINEALRFDPYEQYAWNLRIDVLKAKGDRQGAQNAAYDALKVFPENDHAHAMAGVLTLSGGDREAGISHLGEAVRLEPNVGWVRQSYAQAIEERSLIARVFVGISRTLRETLAENVVLLCMPWFVYLIWRQRFGPAYNWEQPPALLFVPLHLILVATWWSPWVSFIMTRGEGARRVVAAELSYSDRTRWRRPWHICVSLGISLSVLSLLVPGDYLAPQAMSLATIAIALRTCELPDGRASRFVAYFYAIVVALIAIVWSFNPHALLFGKDIPRSDLNYAFNATLLGSIGVLAIAWKETDGKRSSGI